MYEDKQILIPPDGHMEKRDVGEEVNRYYLSVSYRYKLLKYFTLLALVIFTLTMLTAYREYITYDNVRFLLRDLDEAAKSDNGDIIGTIRYDADGNKSYALYKGNLTVAGESQLSVYNASGRQLLSKTLVGAKPVAVSSDKYLLVYDLGGYKFSVYNLLTELYSETLDYPVNGAAVADNGSFAVLTQTLEHRSAVFLYDKNFKLIGKYLKDKYVTDIELKSDGSELLIVSFYAADGEYMSEIAVCKPKESTEKHKFELKGAFPLRAGYFNDGGYSIVCDGAIFFYDNNSKLLSTYQYGAMTLVSADVGGAGLAAIFNKNIVGRENSAVVFDTKGNIIYNNIIGDTCADLRYWGDYVFMLTESEVIRISPSSSDAIRIKVESGAQRLLVYDENTLMLCYTGRTQTVRLD